MSRRQRRDRASHPSRAELPPGIFAATRDAFAAIGPPEVHARQSSGETHVFVIYDDHATQWAMHLELIHAAPTDIVRRLSDRGWKGMLRLRLHFRLRSQVEPGELDGSVTSELGT